MKIKNLAEDSGQSDEMRSIAWASMKMIERDGDVIEIDGSLYHCHPAVSNLLNSLWEQIEGMKESIKALENARN